MKNKGLRTAVKFALTGIFNTVFGSFIMFFMYNVVGAGYWLSTAVNYGVCSIISFFLSKYLIFQNEERPFRQIARFSVNILFCYIIAYGVAKPVVYAILESREKALCENIAMLTGMGFFAILNYLGQRFFVFRREL